MDGPEIIGLYYLKSFKLITQFRAYGGQCWRQRNVIFSASLGYSNCSPPSHLNLNLTPFRGLQWAKWRKRTGIFWTICSTDQLLYHPPTPNHLGMGGGVNKTRLTKLWMAFRKYVLCMVNLAILTMCRCRWSASVSGKFCTTALSLSLLLQGSTKASVNFQFLSICGFE